MGNISINKVTSVKLLIGTTLAMIYGYKIFIDASKPLAYVLLKSDLWFMSMVIAYMSAFCASLFKDAKQSTNIHLKVLLIDYFIMLVLTFYIMCVPTITTLDTYEIIALCSANCGILIPLFYLFAISTIKVRKIQLGGLLVFVTTLICIFLKEGNSLLTNFMISVIGLIGIISSVFYIYKRQKTKQL